MVNLNEHCLLHIHHLSFKITDCFSMGFTFISAIILINLLYGIYIIFITNSIKSKNEDEMALKTFICDLIGNYYLNFFMSIIIEVILK